MADVRNVEANAVHEKRKFDSIDETFEEKVEVLDVRPESNKRQKLQTLAEIETNTTCSFPVQGKTAVSQCDGHNAGGNKDEDLAEIDKGKAISAEAIDVGQDILDEIIYRASRLSVAEKGKGIMIEEPDEIEESDEELDEVPYEDLFRKLKEDLSAELDEFDYSSDNSDSGFSGDHLPGLDSGSEDIPF